MAGKDEKKRLKKTRVQLRRNQAPTVRKKDWTRLYLQGQEEEIEDLAVPSERIGKTERTRKRTVVETVDGLPAPAAEQDQKTGVVLAVRGQYADVDEAGRTWRCVVRGLLRKVLLEERTAVTVGDRVRFTPLVADPEGNDEGAPDGVMEAVLPRKGILARQYEDRLHIIAANVDQALIVSSVDLPPLRPHLIDRGIVAAEAGQIEPVIVVNKLDLDEEGVGREVLQRYAALGYRTLGTSVVTGEGIEQLKEVLKDKSSVLIGQSGVGKSSLLNAVQPGLRLRVGDVNVALKRGRHTTTTAQLLKLEFGGYVVDTPGIRQLELPKIEPGELEAYFVEFVDRVKDCKFADCTHIHEEGCAIKAAVERGEIHPERYESYVRMFMGESEPVE